MNAPAKAVDLAVTAVRLPVSLAERIMGQDAVSGVPGVRVASAAQAWLLETSGIILGDDRLTARASLLRAALDRRAEADRLDAEAAEVRRRGEHMADARREEASALRAEAGKAADAQRRRVEAAGEAKKRAARETMARKTAVVERTDEHREERLAADERAAKRAVLVDERQALAAEREAAEAEREVLDLEDELESTKAHRRHTPKKS